MRVLVLLVFVALFALLPAAVAVNGPVSVRGTVGVPFICAIDASGGSPLTYAATPLPTGLVINAATGRISGTPSAAGVTVVTITAIGATSASASMTVTVDAAAGPSVTNATEMVVSDGSACAFQLVPSAGAGTFAIAGLPGTLSLSVGGLISGTPAAAALYNLDVSGDAGVTATTMVLEVLPAVVGAPVFTTPAPQPEAAVGATFACFVGSSSADGDSCSNLPAWLSLDASSGLLSGTPGSTDLAANLRVTAHGTGQASTMFAIPVAVPAVGDPLTASPAVIEGTVGCALSWQATTDVASSFALSSLPAGLSLDAASGLLSGSPSVSGDQTALLTATPTPPALPVVTSVALRIHPAVAGAPVIDALSPPVLTVGSPAAIAIPTSGGVPTTFGSGDLNPFTIDTTGIITGTPTVAGSRSLPISASNALGSATTTILVQINDPVVAAPLPSSPVLFRTTVGAPFSAALTADTTVDTWSVTGLPGAIALAPFTGHLTGIAAAAGDSNLVLSAADVDGSNPTHGVLRVVAATVGAPLITSAGPWFVGSGQPVRLQLLADQASIWSCSGLPTGLTVDADGLISGSSTVVGTHCLEISAAVGAGSTLTTALLVIENAVAGAPVLNDLGVLSGTVGVPFSATLTASNTPDWFALSPLPAWLTLVSATGALSGTPSAAGDVVVQVTTGNASGSSRSLLVISIAAAPVVVTPSPPADPVSGVSGGGCSAGAAGFLIAVLLLVGLRRRR